MQNRIGPSIIGGVYSILQPLVDGLKLLFKLKININFVNTYLFNCLLIFILSISIILILFIPISNKLLILQIPFNLLLILILLLLSSILIIIIGLLSNNKLALLSSLRHFSVLYSYSLSIIIIFFGISFINSSFNLIEIKVNILSWSYLFFNFFLAFWVLIILINEIKKIGFDILESEGELAGGFSIEFSELNFALLVLSEYIYFISFLLILIIVTMPNINLIIILTISLIVILFFRAILPNYRFDYIMTIFWKYFFIFILLSNLLIIFIVLI